MKKERESPALPALNKESLDWGFEFALSIDTDIDQMTNGHDVP